MNELVLQAIIIICFIGLVVVLFFEDSDYLTYSVLFTAVAGISTAVAYPEAQNLLFYISFVEWEIIFFLVGVFTIVEALNENMVFHELSSILLKRYKNHPRRLFYAICITSTLVATVLEDVSVAIIFGPMIVIACREIKTNPTPYLMGMTICINLASTLTPFGSAENVIIFNAMNLSLTWFLESFFLFFVVTTAVTLVLLDRFVLIQYPVGTYERESDTSASGISSPTYYTSHPPSFYEIHPPGVETVEESKIDRRVFWKNVFGLVVFTLLLVSLQEIYLASLLGALLFTFLNPVKKNGTGQSEAKGPSISHYFNKVDYKLIYFFICLFILVGLMETSGIFNNVEALLENLEGQSLFLVSVSILLITSLLSGLIDNAPVTVLFLPIIQILITSFGFHSLPLIVAFVLGINLGGNFLPQGSACDMMTLEIARTNRLEGFTYRRLVKIGGLFALLHIVLGIGYIWFITQLILV